MGATASAPLLAVCGVLWALRWEWGQEPIRREARSQVKLKRDASAALLPRGAIEGLASSLVLPWRLFLRGVIIS